MQYKIQLKNNSASSSANLVFFTKGQPISQRGSTNTFTLPYTATYSIGQYFRINAGSVNYYIYLNEVTTREDIVTKLNALNFGDWNIDSSTSYNIFNCFCSVTISVLELDYYKISAPTTIAATSVGNTSFYANWSAVIPADSYYLDVATDSGFTTIISGYNNLNVGNVTTYNVTGLTAGTTYYYRVRSYYSTKNITSNNSNTTNITTTAISATWSSLTSGTVETLRSVSFYNTVLGIASGTNGTLLKTSDGASWSPKTSGTLFDVNKVFFLNSTTAFWAGFDGVFKSTDIGESWTGKLIGITFGQLWSIHFPTSLIGWTCGQIDFSPYRILANSIDGGESWTNITITETANIIYYDVFFLDANVGWACGFNYDTNAGVILKTTNGGVNWNPLTITTAETLNSIYFISANNGFCVGTNGKIYSTTNGGTSWGEETSGLSGTLNYIKLADALNGWICGDSGKILKTTNGGTSWGEETSGTAENLYGLSFIDSSHGYACGANGVILKYS